MNTSFLTFILTLITMFSVGQTTDTIYPIDIKCRECLDTALIKTSNMMGCFAEARDAWEVEMNKYYNLLNIKLKEEQVVKLQLAQSAWIVYKDKEFELSGYIYYASGMGSERRIDAVARQCELFRHRTLELIEYYNAVSGSE